MEPKIIYEDNELLVLDKPPGWVVNESTTSIGQKVLQEWLKQLDYPISSSEEYRCGIVHRLDKETSGILLVAKTVKVYIALQKQFKDRLVEKTYICLVHGILEPEKGIIQTPLGRLPWRRDRFGILPKGRESITEYRAVGSYGNMEKYTLVYVYPKTGRTHQIRVHMKYIGHPIVSDEFYAGRKTSRKDRLWCPRLFLHAQAIKFRHPQTKKMLSFKLDLPEDLELSLSSLGKI